MRVPAGAEPPAIATGRAAPAIARAAAPLVLALAWLALAVCASLPPAYYGDTVAPELEQTPFFAQRLHQCGPAALATVLVSDGVAITPEQLAARIYLPARHGSLQAELLAATRRLGRVPYRVAPTIESIAREVAAGHPVVVLQNLALPVWPRWHYAVVIGVDQRRIALRSGRHRLLHVNRARFVRRWRYAGYWGFVALAPGQASGDPDVGRWLEAYSGFEQIGAPDVAYQGYLAGVRRWPDDARLRFALGNAHYAQHQATAAEADYRAAAELAPGLGAAWNNLAQVLGERGCRDAALDALAHADPQGDSGLAAALAATRAALPATDRAGCPATWR